MDLDELQRMLWHFASHRVLTTASRAGIFARLAGTYATAEEVACDLHLEVGPCAKVLGALSALGVLEAKDGAFTVTPGLQAYFSPGDADLGPFIEHSHSMYENWGANLEGWLKSGEWRRGERSPEQTFAFARAMVAMGRQIAKRAEALLGLDQVERMLDVGGGHGHWAEVFCSKHEQLKATVFDIPANAESGRVNIASTAFADRIDFIGGDYLADDLEGPYDFVLLANILHQENEKNAPKLLEKCAASLVPGGRVAIVEFQIDEARNQHVFGTLFAINMRDFGDTWTESQLRSWMKKAGLGGVTRQDLGPERWIMIGEKLPD